MPVLTRLFSLGPACLWLFTFALLCTGQESKTKYFSVASVPEYKQPERALSILVRRDAKVPLNHFCMVGFRYSEGRHDYEADVYWKENHAITQWLGPSGDADDLLQSDRTWNLNKDVAPSGKEIESNKYAVTKEEVDQIVVACERLGQKFVIQRTPPGTKNGSSAVSSARQ